MIEDRPYVIIAGAGRDDAIRRLQEHAAGFIPCPGNQTRVRRVALEGSRGTWYVIIADGCGQRILYGEGNRNVRPVAYYVLSRFSLEPGTPR